MARTSRALKQPENPFGRTMRVLAFLMICSIVLGGFVYTVMIKKSSHTTIEKQPHDIAPIRVEDLGKTPGELKRKYPELFLQMNIQGLMIGTHELDNADYTIWFVAENNEYKAFRLQSVKNHPGSKERDITAYFGQLYGRPFDSYCSGKTAASQDNCHYKWWVRKNVTFDLYSRLKSDGSITMRNITTDSYLVSKHFDKIKGLLPTQ